MTRRSTIRQSNAAYSLPVLGVMLLAAAVLAPGAFAQKVSIQAYANETTISVDDDVTYAIEVSGASFSDLQPPDAPRAEGLSLRRSVSRRSSRVTYRNGKMKRSVTFRWTYRPQHVGKARIEATQVRVQGRTYRTEPIPIHVTHPSSASRRRGRRPGNAPRKRDAPDEDALFIRATTSSHEVYQGEQATLTYRLYFRPDYRVRSSRMAGSWDAQGFWREDLDVDTRPVPHTTTVDGERYKSIVLKRAAVFPTRAGSLRVDPLRIETKVQPPTHSRNLFDRFFSVGGDYEKRELASPAVPIRVRPLPGGAPSSFHGAVGSFQMEAQVDRRALEAGEPVEVTVQLSGSGNLSTLPPPSLNAPDAFDAYDPDVSTTFERKRRRLYGRKTFTYVLVPSEAGTFELPPVRFAYFDPDAESYKTLREKLPTIRVKGVPDASPADTARAALPAHGIAGLMTEIPLLDARAQAESLSLYRSPWTYAALGLPLLALLGVLGYRRRQDRLAGNPAYARRRKARPAARKHLKEARRLLQEDGDQRSFFAALQRALLGFLGCRLDLPERGLTRGQLDRRLSEAGVPGPLRRKVRRLLAKTDQSRFAPAATDRTARQAALNRTRSLIDALDEALA